METWRKVWRDGLAPLLSSESLEALRRALEHDDPALLQGTTTDPAPLQELMQCPVEAACIIGYCGWRGDGLETVAEVEEYFARMCWEVTQRLGDPIACRWLLAWFDETPRPEMRQTLLAEVNRVLAQRLSHDPDERPDQRAG